MVEQFNMRQHEHEPHPTTSNGHSIHGEPNEPGVALTGVGGHSVHGHDGSEGNVHRSMVVDGIGLRIGGD